MEIRFWKLLQYLEMTEVFIAAVSTTKFQMNDQDLEYYRDEKAKQIQQVRLALEQLHQFTQIPKKERVTANHTILWKNLLILSKILGFQSQFNLIDQLRIPQSILTQQLCSINEPFVLKHYYPRTSIGTWESVSDRYYILMEGIVQKELIRSSISKFESENIQLSLCRANSISKFRKNNNKKRFARTDQQIPICLNSKRSEGRNVEIVPNHFRSLTDVQMFEVSAISWKRYVSDFKRLQEEYLMNFIRKKLNISLNFDKINQKIMQGQHAEQEHFYSLITLQRKSFIEFTETDLFLLYKGEMLIKTSNYKVQVSQGCILNPAIYQKFIKTSKQLKYELIGGKSIAKNLATIIKISIKKLQTFLKVAQWQRSSFIQLLKGLQNNRKRQQQEQKIENIPTLCSTENLQTNIQQSKMIHKFMCGEPSREGLKTISQSPQKLSKKVLEMTPKIRCKNKIMGLKNIQNIVEKTAKAAELKHIEYLKKAHLSQDASQKHLYDENSSLPESIFKDCMKNIQTKNQLLKQAVKLQKQKFKHQYGSKQKLLYLDSYGQINSKIKMMPITDGSIYIKKRIKDIYVRTEGSQEMVNFASSQRQTAIRCSNPKIPTRQTVGASLQMREYQPHLRLQKWFPGGLGIMKKVQTGKIRRIKLK